jgi:serine/threonine protein kinase
LVRGATVDGRSDLFSVGGVLYEMVTGRRAFRGDSITALLFKVITEQPDYGLIPRDPEWGHLSGCHARGA